LLKGEPVTSQPRTLTSDEEKKLFAGLAVQPFLAAGLAFVSFPFILLERNGRVPTGGFLSADAAISVALGVGAWAVFVTLIGVLPTALWVVKRRALPLRHALLFGLAFGDLPVILGTVLSGGSGVAGPLRPLVLASTLGVAGAAVFWAISIRGQDFSREPAAG